METFLKTIGCIILLLLFCLVLEKNGKDFSMVIATAGCCLIAIIVIGYTEPLISFISELNSKAKINTDIYKTIIKSVGIALLAEFCNLICIDCGNSAIGRMVQILGSTVILWLSIPLFKSFLSLIENILLAL